MPEKIIASYRHPPSYGRMYASTHARPTCLWLSAHAQPLTDHRSSTMPRQTHSSITHRRRRRLQDIPSQTPLTQVIDAGIGPNKRAIVASSRHSIQAFTLTPSITFMQPYAYMHSQHTASTQRSNTMSPHHTSLVTHAYACT
jgi:hypothetical protein